ncbi:MAG TPA: tetratricopeptide repeat protein [Longimicrobiales bacterium]|nr:tetratricopeptide repeat protein [Longimicrobiales bacterium]
MSTPSHGAPVPLLERRRTWEAAAALLAVVLYLRTVGYGWVFDDQMEVVLNTFIRSWDALPRILTTTVWTGSGMETYLYRPLSQVTFLANHVVSGLDPWSYHLVNVLLHAGVSVLVVRIGTLWGLPAAAAGLGGIFFALHPLHVEVVAAVHGRKDLLAALFVLAFVLGHFRARAQAGRWIPLTLLALVAAVLSKETGFMALALVAVVEVGRTRNVRAPLRDAAGRGLYAAYGATLAAAWLLRTRITGSLGVPETAFWDNPLVGADPWVRLGTALAVLGRGVGSLLLPVTLSPDYSYDAIPLVRGAGDPRLVLTLALGALLGWLAWHFRRSHPWVGVALLWYLLALFPGSNLALTVGTLFGDRLLYLPSVAFCLGLGWVLHPRSPRVRPLALALSAAVAGGLAFQTARYTSAWTDDIALFEWAVEAVPASTKAHHKLGEEYLRAGRLGDALGALNRAVTLAPDNVYAAATRTLALEAVAREYAAALAAPLQAVLPRDARVLHALGQILRARGDLEGSLRMLGTALERDPGLAVASEELGVFLLQAGDTVDAIPYLEAALRADPALVTPWFTLGRVYLGLGDGERGLEALGRFVREAGARYPEQVAWARGQLEAARR